MTGKWVAEARKEAGVSAAAAKQVNIGGHSMNCILVSHNQTSSSGLPVTGMWKATQRHGVEANKKEKPNYAHSLLLCGRAELIQDSCFAPPNAELSQGCTMASRMLPNMHA